MATNVDEQTLLEGSWWALEQAGRLLGSATMLFEGGDFSTALAVAMFGREELGRSRLLRDCAQEVRQGKSLQPHEITKRCNEHVRKQQASAFHIALNLQLNSQVRKALSDLSAYDPSSEQRKGAGALIDSAVEAKGKRLATDRDQDRCSSLYVDLNPQGTDWRRPAMIDEDKARHEINSAISDYTYEVNRLTNEELHPNLEQHQPHLSVKAMSIARSKMQHTVDIPQPQFV